MALIVFPLVEKGNCLVKAMVVVFFFTAGVAIPDGEGVCVCRPLGMCIDWKWRKTSVGVIGRVRVMEGPRRS